MYVFLLLCYVRADTMKSSNSNGQRFFIRVGAPAGGRNCERKSSHSNFQVTCHGWQRSWCWERLRAGGKGGSRGWETPGDSEGQKSPVCCCLWVAKSQLRPSDWTTVAPAGEKLWAQELPPSFPGHRAMVGMVQVLCQSCAIHWTEVEAPPVPGAALPWAH